MNFQPGEFLVTDFDGTLCMLEIDWKELRANLQVESIDELWEKGMSFASVTQAELDAVSKAPLMPCVLDRLLDYRGCVILTSNSEETVGEFLSMHGLRSYFDRVVGRETLAGPKRDRGVFDSGFQLALSCFDLAPGDRVDYVGDQDYECEFAKDNGARAWLYDFGSIVRWAD